MENKIFEELEEKLKALGAYNASVICVKEITFDRSFRDMCRMNACGMYGKCLMCPPDVGDIDELISNAGEYDFAIVYQTVTELEDCYDFEGMTEAKKRTALISQKMRGVFKQMNISKVLHLSVGACGVCKACSKLTDEPCRHPELAMPSLEAYGVDVSALAKAAGMKYVNGKDTVTYFGAVLFSM